MNGLEYVQQLAFAHVATRALIAGVFLNVFNIISPSGNSAQEIAARTHCSLRGMRMLLDTLASLNLLKKTDGKYFLTMVAKDYLKKDSSQYIGQIWETADSLLPWDHLIASIKTGKPWKMEIYSEEENRSFASLDRSLHVVHSAAAQRAAHHLTHGCASLKVLDIACGSGIWGLAIARKMPEARVVAQDFPPILSLTRRYVELERLENQFTYLPGDLRNIHLGEDEYDLIVLGNILHYEGEFLSQKLLKRVHAALHKDGRVAIIDIVTNEERTAPQAAVAFALFLLLASADGDVFTFGQYEKWLQETGFTNIETVEIGGPSPMIVARKISGFSTET